MRNSKPVVKLISLAILLVFIGLCTWWFIGQNRTDDSVAIDIQVYSPDITNYQQDPPVIKPMFILFTGAAAPIDAVNKEVTDGLKITPTINGVWSWSGDKELVFTPQHDWTPGAEYKVKIGKPALNPHKKYTEAVLAPQLIKIESFNAQTHSSQFHQDPVRAEIRQAIVEINFSHPVNRLEFEKAITVNLIRENKDNKITKIKGLNFKVAYDDYGLKAWISSETVNLADAPNQFIETKIAPTFAAQQGGNKNKQLITSLVNVPTKYSLQVDKVATIFVDNDKNEVERLLQLRFNQGVKLDDVRSNIKISLLPEYRTKDSINWRLIDVTEEVLRDRAIELTPEIMVNEYDFSQQYHIKFQAPAEGYIFVTINPDIHAIGGYTMKKPVNKLIQLPDYPRQINFVGEGALLALSGDKKVAVSSRNFNYAKVEIGTVQTEQLRHIVSLNRNGSFMNPILGDLQFDHIADFNTQIVTMNNSEPQKAHYFDLDLSKVFTGDEKASKGIFWLKVSGQMEKDAVAEDGNDRDMNGKYNWNEPQGQQYSDYRLVVLTDLGIIAKQEIDGSQVVFVQSIHTGLPVSNAEVQVITRNGSVIDVAETDEQGLVRFKSFKDKFSQELTPIMYLVKHEQDTSFLPINQWQRQLDYSRFDVDGVVNEVDNRSLSSYLFTDRGIYRPSETLHVGIITKAVDWQVAIDELPLWMKITSSTGKTMHEQIINVAENGLNSLDYTIPDNAHTGTWRVELFISKNDYAILGSVIFQVQEFQPDNLKIGSSFSKRSPGWVAAQDLFATVKLENLFGTPAQNRLVTAELNIQPTWPSFSLYQDYKFYDDQRSSNLHLIDLDNEYTDTSGNAKFNLNLEQYADNTVQMLHFTADGFEGESGRSVSTIQSIMVSNQPLMIGYKSKVNLNYLPQNQASSVDLIAIDPQLAMIKLENITATLVERKMLSVLTQKSSGAYQYESKLVEQELSKQTINIDQTGLSYALTTDKTGDYAVIFTNQDNQQVNKINYTVVGDGFSPAEISKNATLQLRLNKNSYEPGEEIEIAINAPYIGSGLITIERDYIYAHKWFTTNTNSSIQTIKLPEHLTGNAYINIQFIRDPNSKEIFMSPLSYAIAPFAISVDKHSLNLALSAKKEVKPGEKLDITLTTEKPTKAIVYAVNEGILQVAQYKFIDPLKHFFRKRMLQVETSQILDLILPDFAKIMQFAKTGGGYDYGDEELALLRAANQNPFKRQREKAVVFWSGIIDVDGDKTVSYMVPDYFNGNLKIMAIALDKEHIGSAEASTLVRSDVILTPNTPFTLTPGDEAVVSVTVTNNIKSEHEQVDTINISLQADPQFRILDAEQKDIQLKSMHEAVVSFKIKASEQLGAGDLIFNADYLADAKPATIARKVNISVRPLVTQQTFSHIGKIVAGKDFKFAQLRNLYPNYNQQYAVFATTPLILVQGITAYLIKYDNYCTEQVVSAAMPNIILANKPEFKTMLALLSNNPMSNMPEKSTVEIKHSIAKVFEILVSRQNSYGQFGTWNNIGTTSNFVSTYTTHFLMEAHERNITVPSELLKQSLLGVTSIAARNQEDMSLVNLRHRAYASYLSASAGLVTTDALVSIRSELEKNYTKADWQSDLVSAWMAATYKLLKLDDEAELLIAPVMKKLSAARTKDWLYANYEDPLIYDATALYILAKHFPEKLATIGDVILERISTDLNEQRYNTLSSAMIILALDAYSQNTLADRQQLQIQSVLADGRVIDGKQEGTIQLAKLNEQTKEINFINNSAKPAWFAVIQNGYTKVEDGSSAISHQLEIERDYLDKEGKPVTKVQLGDTIKVNLKIRALDKVIYDVVITDLIPAGFEIIWQDGTDNGPANDFWWNPEHIDLREDRILSYGALSTDTKFISYNLKATTVGEFNIPLAYAESMYDRSIKAQASSKGTIIIESLNTESVVSE